MKGEKKCLITIIKVFEICSHGLVMRLPRESRESLMRREKYKCRCHDEIMTIGSATSFVNPMGLHGTFHGKPWHSVELRGIPWFSPWNSMAAVESRESSVEFATEIAVEFAIEISWNSRNSMDSIKISTVSKDGNIQKFFAPPWVTKKHPFCRRKKEARTEARTAVPPVPSSIEKKTPLAGEKNSLG